MVGLSKLVSFATVVALWTLEILLIKLIRILLKKKHIQDKNYAIFAAMLRKRSCFVLFCHIETWLVPSRLQVIQEIQRRERWVPRKGAQGEMGREKTKEEDDWEILVRKVVPRVEKLCEAVLATFFAIDWFSVFSLLFGWVSFICLATVSVLSWLGISSKNYMASSGNGDSTCEGVNLKELNDSIHQLSNHGKLWNDKKLILMV